MVIFPLTLSQLRISIVHLLIAAKVVNYKAFSSACGLEKRFTDCSDGDMRNSGLNGVGDVKCCKDIY